MLWNIDRLGGGYRRRSREIGEIALDFCYPGYFARRFFPPRKPHLTRNGDRPYPDVLRTIHGAIAASIADWSPFTDSGTALRALKKHYRLVVLSNVDDAGFAASSRHLDVVFDSVFTAQAIGSYKPDAANFRYMLERLGESGTKRGDILHCAQSLYHDIVPAKRLGLATAWINRRHGKPGTGATPPVEAAAEREADFEFPSLSALAAAHREEFLTQSRHGP